MLAARKRTQGVGAIQNQQTRSRGVLELQRDRYKSSYENPSVKPDSKIATPPEDQLHQNHPAPFLNSK